MAGENQSDDLIRKRKEYSNLSDYNNAGFNVYSGEIELDGFINKPISEKISLPDAVSEIFGIRLRILKKPIEEINDAIRIRRVINKSISDEIDSKHKHIEFLLRDLDNWTMGCNDSIERRRLELQRELLSLEKEKRSEKLRFWEDVVSLANKRTEFLIEYRTLKSISELL